MPRPYHVLLAATLLSGSLLAQGAPSSNWPDNSPSAPGPVPEAAGLDQGLGGTREPTIAVNPLDPRNLAMSSLFQSRVSIDGGVSWTAGVLNTVPGGYVRDGDPCLAFDHLGRLFYSYQGFHLTTAGADEFVARLDPTTGALISGPVKVSSTGTTGASNDKDWLAADRWPASPFAGRLYLVWTEFPLGGSTFVWSKYSSDQGATWSTALLLSSATFSEGFVWPAHVAVAPNGDVFVSYHAQVTFTAAGVPDGTSGCVYVLRSTDGGASFPQKTLAFTAGNADITYNVQHLPQAIPNFKSWTQGSGQAWVLPDPAIAGQVYVVACDDPDNLHGSGDEANVYIASSSDSGVSWSAPTRVDDGPATSFALFPSAAIDDHSGNIVVLWYDNRLGGFNAGGSYLLNLYYAVSFNHGASFEPAIKINDSAFNPDLGAPTRFAGPPPTYRIGEYIGVAALAGEGFAVWCGNTAGGQQIVFDSAPGATTGTSGVRYCTAQVNSQGCTPAIAISGSASATAGSGLLISCTDELNNRSGILFYGFSGRQHSPFLGGTLCMHTPLRRAPLLSSGGNAPPDDCSGVFTFDMNAFAVGSLGGSPDIALLTLGARIDCQFWSRDPAHAPHFTNLSAAAEYQVGP